MLIGVRRDQYSFFSFHTRHVGYVQDAVVDPLLFKKLQHIIPLIMAEGAQEFPGAALSST